MIRQIRLVAGAVLVWSAMPACFAQPVKPYEPGPNTLFLCHFEGTAKADHSRGPGEPTKGEGRFVPGRFGKGVRLDAKSRLSYAGGKNIDFRQGTIEFFFKPDWDGGDKASHRFLSVRTDKANYINLNFNGAQKEGRLGGGINSRAPGDKRGKYVRFGAAAHDIEKGRWYHFAVSWGPDGLRMYLDGTEVDVQKDARPPHGSPRAFTVGCDGVLDEFRISDKPLGAAPGGGRSLAADNGSLAVHWREGGSDAAQLSLGQSVVGTVGAAIAIFEKKGAGYKGTGIGSATADRVKSITPVTQEPGTCVVDVVVERTRSEETMRRFEATYRFTLRAGQPWCESRLVSVTNTDSVPYDLVGYYHRLQPVPTTGWKAYTHGGCAAWLDEGRFVAALLKQEEEFTLGFRVADGRCVGDITRKLTARLAPGESWTGDEPAVLFYAGAGRRAFAADTDHIRKLLAKPSAPEGAGTITYTETTGR